MEYLLVISLLFFIVGIFLYFLKNTNSKIIKPLLKNNKNTTESSKECKSTLKFLQTKDDSDKRAETNSSLSKKDNSSFKAKNNPLESKNYVDYKILNKLTYHFIESLEWKSFEQICFLYFQQKGYKAELSPFGADEGVDIYLYKPDDSFTPHVVIQCKAWHSRVGVAKIRELYGSMFAKKAEFAIFMAISGFTYEAENFASNKNIELIDGNRFICLIKKLSVKQQKKIILNIISEDYTTPTCPSCNIKMVIRKNQRDGSQFWGCKNFPGCRKTFKYNPKYHV